MEGMRGRLVLACALAGLLLAAGVARAAPQAGRAVVVHLRSTLVSAEMLRDTGAEGLDRPGDVLRMRDTVANGIPQFGRATGAVVGTDVATVTRLADGRSRLVGSVTLPDGVIRFAGTVTRAGASSVRVVGGTGRYLGATGKVIVRDTQTPGVAINVYSMTVVRTVAA